MHPLLLSQMPAPTVVVSPPAPTTATGATCGTKIRLRVKSVATECEPDDCGTVSIRTFLCASITPRTAFCWLAAGHGDPATFVCSLLLALITSVITSLGLLAGVQPSRILSCGPTVEPFGPQPVSGTT